MGFFDGTISTYLSDEKLEEIGSKNVGSETFQVPIEPLSSLREVLIQANSVDRFLSDNARNAATQRTSELQNSLIEIINFDASKVEQPGRRYGQLVGMVRAQCDILMETVLPAISMRSVHEGQQMREALDEAERIVKKLQATEKVVGSQQAAVASVHASLFFDTQAANHGKSSGKYAIALGLLVLSTIAFSLFWRPTLPSGQETNSQTLARALPTLNTLALAWFTIRLLARNLRNHQHLKVLNETKSMILKSGEQFSVSAQGAPVADNILQIVVASTFTLGDTGYLPGEPEPSKTGNSGIMSLWRSATSKP